LEFEFHKILSRKDAKAQRNLGLKFLAKTSRYVTLSG
jgi:hypothetical protein